MSYPVAAVLALILGVVFLACLGVSHAAGMSLGFLGGVVTFTVVVGFVVLAIFEIKRLAES